MPHASTATSTSSRPGCGSGTWRTAAWRGASVSLTSPRIVLLPTHRNDSREYQEPAEVDGDPPSPLHRGEARQAVETRAAAASVHACDFRFMQRLADSE